MSYRATNEPALRMRNAGSESMVAGAGLIQRLAGDAIGGVLVDAAGGGAGEEPVGAAGGADAAVDRVVEAVVVDDGDRAAEGRAGVEAFAGRQSTAGLQIADAEGVAVGTVPFGKQRLQCRNIRGAVVVVRGQAAGNDVVVVATGE